MKDENGDSILTWRYFFDYNKLFCILTMSGGILIGSEISEPARIPPGSTCWIGNPTSCWRKQVERRKGNQSHRTGVGSVRRHGPQRFLGKGQGLGLQSRRTGDLGQALRCGPGNGPGRRQVLRRGQGSVR